MNPEQVAIFNELNKRMQSDSTQFSAQQRAVLGELSKRMGRPDTEESNVLGDVKNIGEHLNKTLLEGLGGLVDLTNIPIGADKPFLGSEWLKENLGEVGMTSAEGEAETLPEKIAAGVGNVTGAAIPFLGV